MDNQVILKIALFVIWLFLGLFFAIIYWFSAKNNDQKKLKAIRI